MFRRYKKENEVLQQLIKAQKIALQEAEKDKELLLINASELREKITNLENNVEFLVNNLSVAKRKKLGL